MINSGGNLADDRRRIFENWSGQKIRLDGLSDPLFYFYEREIWWASLGKNIGHEMDGKNLNFERPILVIKKILNDDVTYIADHNTNKREVIPVCFQITR